MRQSILALVAVLVLVPGASLACASFGKDESAIDKVQSSWLPAEVAMDHSRYADALRHLEWTYAFVPAIKQPLLRKCVAEGSQQRISMAKAGDEYLSLKPGDYLGAKLAAEKVWRTFPTMHNCP